MNSLSNKSPKVKEYAGAFPAGEEDRATLGSDLSASSAPSGVSAPLSGQTLGHVIRACSIRTGGVKGTPVSGQVSISHSRPEVEVCPVYKLPTSDGSEAINPQEVVFSPKAFSNDGLDVFYSPSSPPVGLFLRVVNSDTRVNTGIIDAFREYCFVLEHKPCCFLHMRNKVDNSTVLYRRTGYSDSRYYPSGRAAIIKKIRQRLCCDSMVGVFFTSSNLYAELL